MKRLVGIGIDRLILFLSTCLLFVVFVDVILRYGIVLLVISAQYEKKEKGVIRKLWAAVKESNMQMDGKSLVIFLVGRSSELEEEASIHRDLLQVDIEETYRNLVYKIFTRVVARKLEIESNFQVLFITTLTSSQYTKYTSCDDHGPHLSIMNTDFQAPKSLRNRTAAW